MSSVRDIKIKNIKVVENHRVNVDKTDLHELMSSIKQHGLKQAIGVSQKGKDKYVLLFGHRRMMACQKLGWVTIPAAVEKDVSEEKLLVINLTENMQRKDPSLAEFGRIINKLEEKMKLSTAEVAARIGIPITKITSIKKIYEGLPEKWRSKVFFMEKGLGRAKKKGMIPAGIANKIVNMKKAHGMKDKTVDKIFNHVIDGGVDSMDLDNVGIMMDSGLDLETALKRMGEYKVYAFSFVAKVSEISELVIQQQMPSLQVIFKKIMYGELPPISKPKFLPSEKGPASKTKQEVAISRNKRFSAMMTSLNVRAKMNTLSSTQKDAVRSNHSSFSGSKPTSSANFIRRLICLNVRPYTNIPV